ncbi:MAG: AAA family ATPase [Deltaproteobacteria bacterium]|nr:AAA family ATPase [Deltaproteobacteria bacterium]
MSHVIAVCGKGGVGKTTISALLARALAAGSDGRVLAVDADPAGGLAMALDWSLEGSINDLRQEILDSLERSKTDKTDLAAAIDYRLLEMLSDRDNLALLAVGRPEEAGCYCNLNTVLREAIEALADHFRYTIVDAEAGLEQVNRRVMRSVTHLLLVTDPGAKGVRVAEEIKALAEEAVEPTRVGLLINRVRSDDEVTAIRSRTSLDVIATIPEDETVRSFDAQARSLLELPACPAFEAVTAWIGDGDFLG